MILGRLEYRLARKKGRQFFGCGERYATKEAAREAAPAVNRERARAGLEPVEYVLTLPARDSGATDPSHLLYAEPL